MKRPAIDDCGREGIVSRRDYVGLTASAAGITTASR